MSSTHTYSYAGKLLRLNLSNGAISTEVTEPYARDWLGASGIAAAILYREVKPWVTAYDPANRLIFGAGALVGTLAPGASRMSGESINTLTGGFGSSNCDSHFGGELKFAGYDSIIIQGKARHPVYLYIRDDKVELRDASHLWGKTIGETLDLLRQELGDNGIHTLSIGPAGENVVRGACVIQDRNRAMGRCGSGAVMGIKNLKAIAVRGQGELRIAQPDRFMNAVEHARELFEKSGSVTGMRRAGTPAGVRSKQDKCGIPYKNFQSMCLPPDMLERLDQEILQERFRVRNISYPACAINCSRYFRVSEGDYAPYEGEGFQFEALADFCGKLGVDDPVFAMQANAYCNQMGLDIDLAAGAIAWATECYQRGILKKQDTDNMELTWGDGKTFLELIRKIVWREGFGNILAEGSARATSVIGRGSDYYAITMKGQDLYEGMRTAVGWALGCATSTRGGGHTTGAPAMETLATVNQEKGEEVYGVATFNKPLAYEGKAELVTHTEHLHRITNSLGICHFHTTWLDPVLPGFPELAELYSAATGWETSAADLRYKAERQLNIEKAFNLLHTGFDRKDDYPTSRDMTEAVPEGKSAGFKLERQDWDRLLDEYYELHGWDKKTSFPTRENLDKLGLRSVADDLAKAGKLGVTN